MPVVALTTSSVICEKSSQLVYRFNMKESLRGRAARSERNYPNGRVDEITSLGRPGLAAPHI